MYSIDHVIDPFPENPKGETRFELAKLGLRLPFWGEGEGTSSFLEEAEIREISREVLKQEIGRGRTQKIQTFFVTKEGVEDPRVENFREKFGRTMRGLF